MNVTPWQIQHNKKGSSIPDIDIGSILSASDSALQFAESVIAQSNFSTQTITSQQTHINQIQHCRTDPIYVAVVGEFNSGKSTFIHAQLHYDLLKSSISVHTAAANHIVYSSRLDLMVLFKHQLQPISYSRGHALLLQQLTHLAPDTQLADSQPAYLYMITTVEAVAEHIKEITIYHPSSFLQQHIVIIDTLGINAQDKGKKLHTAFIQKVVEQEADLAIVIIPAYSAFSNVLYEFMCNSLKPFLHRCIRILAHMNQTSDATERQLIVKDVRARIVDFVRSTTPIPVYEAEAKVVLDTLGVFCSCREHIAERTYGMSENIFEEQAPGSCTEEWLSIFIPCAKQRFLAGHQERVQPFSETMLQKVINAGDKRKDLERGIMCLHQALSLLQKDVHPISWALAHLYLGFSYAICVTGERIVNQDRAIFHYNSSLDVFTRIDFACQWATLQNSLGEIYRNRIRGTRGENLHQAIHYCQNALQVRTYEIFPIEWALTQATIGAAYGELGLNASAPQQIFEKAFEHYDNAMQVLMEENFPVQWAIVQQGLSAIYFMRNNGKKTDNAHKAITHGQSALRILTRTIYPFEWANTHTSLGEAYRRASLHANLQELYSGRSVMQEQAIRHLEAALQVYTQRDYPLEWARVQRFQGMLYRERVQGKRYENLAQARDCFEQANLSMRS